ncbi:hypothetical protein [Ferrovibrio xuzhouensis]|uniref:Uncharacterized protein n=1 Tax=Ferrovibrio xuzhouensis TaxID=1576914 RepID=A0ABV7VHA6_9PROT
MSPAQGEAAGNSDENPPHRSDALTAAAVVAGLNVFVINKLARNMPMRQTFPG